MYLDSDCHSYSGFIKSSVMGGSTVISNFLLYRLAKVSVEVVRCLEKDTLPIVNQMEFSECVVYESSLSSGFTIITLCRSVTSLFV